MRKLLPIALAVGGYFAWHFYQTKKAIYKLKVSLSGLQIKHSDLLNTVLHLTLSVANPTDTTLAFKQLTGFLLYGGKKVAHFDVKSDKDIIIKANKVTPVPVNATLRNLNALSVLPLMFKSGMNGISIKGTINISGVHVPVDLDYNDL